MLNQNLVNLMNNIFEESFFGDRTIYTKFKSFKTPNLNLTSSPKHVLFPFQHLNKNAKICIKRKKKIIMQSKETSVDC